MRIMNNTDINAQLSSPRPTPGDDLGKDDFLRLLMTQMGAQDPLSPMDNTQFVAQLTQFASLERLDNMAVSLDNMAMTQVANTSAQMVTFIGREVRVNAAEVTIPEEGGGASLGYNLPSDAESVEILVRGPNNRVLRTLEVGATSAGDHTVTWDGLDSSGNPVEAGTYSIQVKAEDGEENAIEATTQLTRRVVGVTFEGGYPLLVLQGGTKVRLGDVIEVTANE